MVHVSLDKNGYTGSILLQPHISLSWLNNVRIFMLLCFISLIVTLYFIQKGAWLVLPFFSLELLIFFISITLFFRRYYFCEFIRFSENLIEVEHGCKKRQQSWQYQRHWSKFYIQQKAEYDMPRVLLKSHGNEIELGSCLCHSEKIYLIKLLKDITQQFLLSNNNNPSQQ